MFEVHHFVDNHGATLGPLVFGVIFGIYGIALMLNG